MIRRILAVAVALAVIGCGNSRPTSDGSSAPGSKQLPKTGAGNDTVAPPPPPPPPLPGKG